MSSKFHPYRILFNLTLLGLTLLLCFIPAVFGQLVSDPNPNRSIPAASPNLREMLTPRDSNGMDMSMDGAMPLMSGNMLTYFHFTVGGDVLWFQGWVPLTSGSMFGACVGLFLLALVERWIAGCRGLMEAFWTKR